MGQASAWGMARRRPLEYRRKVDTDSPISAKELCSSLRVVIGFLFTCLTKVLLALLVSLVGQPALGRVWVVLHTFHFLMMLLTVHLGTFNTREIVLYPSPDLCLLTILSQSSWKSFYSDVHYQLWDFI